MLCLLNHSWVHPFCVQWEENSVSGGFIFLMWSFPRDFLLFIRTSTATAAAAAVVASHESIECEQQIRRRPLVQHGQQFWLKTSWRADAIKLYIFLVFGHSWQHSGRFRRQTTWGSNPVIISTTRFGDLFPFGRFYSIFQQLFRPKSRKHLFHFEKGQNITFLPWKLTFSDFWGRGGGQFVSVLAFNSNEQSSNPAEAYSFFAKFLFEKNENKQKDAGIGPF